MKIPSEYSKGSNEEGYRDNNKKVIMSEKTSKSEEKRGSNLAS